MSELAVMSRVGLLGHGASRFRLDRAPWRTEIGRNSWFDLRNLSLVVRSIGFIAAAYMTFLTGALAAPPEDADAYLAPWFSSLSASDGTPCCAIADCRRTTSRLNADGYEVLVDDTWVAVPWDRIVRTDYNPTGQAVVCCAPRTKIILCFVRPPDS